MKKLIAAICAIVLIGFSPIPASAATSCATCLTVNQSSFSVGDTLILSLKNVQPNTEIFWSITLDGEVFADDQSLDQMTNASGVYTWNAGTLESEDVGSWVVTASVGSTESLTAFTVMGNDVVDDSAPATFTMTIDKSEYARGQAPYFTITNAPASSEIHVTNWYNYTEKQEEFKTGIFTNAMGSWSGYIPAVNCGCVGNWITVLRVNDSVAYVTYSVGEDVISGSSDGLWQFKNSSIVYYSEDDVLYPFTSYYGYQVYTGQTEDRISYIEGQPQEYDIAATSAEALLGLPENPGRMFVSGTLINDKGTIYLIMDGEKIPFANMTAFKELGYSLSNVMKWNLDGLDLKRTSGIFSSDVPHTWGSWLEHEGTVYYSDESGMVAVSDYDIFLDNNGIDSMILPANKYDIEVLEQKSDLPLLEYNDPRVAL